MDRALIPIGVSRPIVSLALSALMVGALLVVPTYASAQACTSVAILATEATSYSPDLQAKLVATGRLGDVALYRYILDSTPLDDYDAVITVVSVTILDENGLPGPGTSGQGNKLADYVDHGGAVVTTIASGDKDVGYMGRFWGSSGAEGNDSYHPLTATSTCGRLIANPLVIDVPSHPIFADVGEVRCAGRCQSYCINATAAPDSTVLATWSQGAPEGPFPAIVVKDSVVAFNLWGVSSDVHPDGFDATSDMAALFANALIFAAGGDPATDRCDADPDADGLTNGEEDAAGTDARAWDTDGDDLADGDEADVGTDPLLADTDHDGTPDGAEDRDGDGLDEATERYDTGTDPLDPDTDADGVPDGAEVTLGFDPLSADSDGDGVTDDLEDDDGDGLDTATELLEGTDPARPDTDADALADGAELAIGTDPLDPDTDADLVLDGADKCPLTADPEQADLDDDGAGDACDPDLDGDAVDNDLDNCPGASNPDQADTDADGTGDACVDDIDGDGVTDDVDLCPATPDPDQVDDDHDGVGDACDDSVDVPVVHGGVHCDSTTAPGWAPALLALVALRRRRANSR